MAETVTVEAAAQQSTVRVHTRGVMNNEEVKQQVDSVAEPIQRNYQSLIQQLRDQNAVGVVVAVNGQIVWADVFASTNLLEKYWPKLVRSYAAEAVVTRTKERRSGRQTGAGVSSTIWTDVTRPWIASPDSIVTRKLPATASERSS